MEMGQASGNRHAVTVAYFKAIRKREDIKRKQ